MYGKRDFKYNFLESNSLKTIDYKELPNVAPNYFFVNKDFKEQEVFNKGFSISHLFLINSIGIVTGNDSVLGSLTKENLKNKVENYFKTEANLDLIRKLSYRPFDIKYIYYDVNLNARAREKIMYNFLDENNIGLNICKVGRAINSHNYFVSNKITDKNLTSSLDSVNTFPLYIYPETGQLSLEETSERKPNFNPEIVAEIAEKLGLAFVAEKDSSPSVLSNGEETFAPIDLLDYIYAVLHSPTYREKYKEFLKIDFPRVPYPKDAATFWKLVALGAKSARSIYSKVQL